MELNLSTASRVLGISEAMLRRLAFQGKIPSLERQGEFFFPLKELKTWAKRRNIPLRLHMGEDSISSHPREITLFDAMKRGGIFFQVDGKDINGVITNAIHRIPLPPYIARNFLIDKILEREAMTSTGIGNGIAIPHPRAPLENLPHYGMISTCFLKEKINYNSIDGKPVFVMFILISQNTRSHLKLLSRLSYCLRDNDFIQFLQHCTDSGELLEVIKKMEKKLT